MYYAEKLPASIVRWRITGSLTTVSPLHLGDGGQARISSRDCVRAFMDLDDVDPLYSTVATGHDKSPVIPATAIKGAWRAWATARRLDEALLRQVFGSETGDSAATHNAARRAGTDPGVGGIVTFHDARLKTPAQPADSGCRLWCSGRSTSLSPQVVINPRTRSAEESLLYYLEYVPEGTTFSVSLTAQGATIQQRALLLYILENAFHGEARPARLGGEVASGWGKMSWSLASLETMDPRAWLKEELLRPWHLALKPVDQPVRAEWLAASRKFDDGYRERTMRVQLTLEFEGAMLINDPSRTR